MEVYRVALTPEAYRIPTEWASHIPKTSQLRQVQVPKPQIYSLPNPQKLNDWYLSDPQWTDVGTLRDRVKLLRHQWLHFQHERISPIALVPSILNVLAASDGMEDKQTISRDLSKLLSLVLMNCIDSKQAYPADFLEIVGTRLERFPGRYQALFREAMTFVPNQPFNTSSWYRRICRAFDEKVIATDAEAKELSHQTKLYAANFVQRAGVLVGRTDVEFDTPKEFEQSETVGLARSIGKRSEQLDGAIYSHDIWAVIDGHGNSGCLTYFQNHMEQRIRAALASRPQAGPASTYNAVSKAILDFHDELVEEIKDSSGLVFVLGVKDGEHLHLFSLGDCTTLLCHPEKRPECLFPPQHIYPKNLANNEMIDRRVFHQALQRSGTLVPLGYNLRLYHNHQGLEMVGVLGDKDVLGVVHRPLYRMLSLEELRGHTLLGFSDGVGSHLSFNDIGHIVKINKSCSTIAQECVKGAVQRAYARCVLLANRKGSGINPSQVDNATCMAIKF